MYVPSRTLKRKTLGFPGHPLVTKCVYLASVSPASPNVRPCPSSAPSPHRRPLPPSPPSMCPARTRTRTFGLNPLDRCLRSHSSLDARRPWRPLPLEHMTATRSVLETSSPALGFRTRITGRGYAPSMSFKKNPSHWLPPPHRCWVSRATGWRLKQSKTRTS